MLTWDDSMLTGIRDLDSQHWQIIEQCNGFAEALATDAFGAEEAEDMLDFLEFYAVAHFNREEDYFQKYQCPAAAANKEAHARFIERFGDFIEQWRQDGMDLETIEETFAEIVAWIETHILRTGSQLRPCLAERSNQQTQETPTVDPE